MYLKFDNKASLVLLFATLYQDANSKVWVNLECMNLMIYCQGRRQCKCSGDFLLYFDHWLVLVVYWFCNLEVRFQSLLNLGIKMCTQYVLKLVANAFSRNITESLNCWIFWYPWYSFQCQYCWNSSPLGVPWKCYEREELLIRIENTLRGGHQSVP